MLPSPASTWSGSPRRPRAPTSSSNASGPTSSCATSRSDRTPDLTSSCGTGMNGAVRWQSGRRSSCFQRSIAVRTSSSRSRMAPMATWSRARQVPSSWLLSGRLPLATIDSGQMSCAPFVTGSGDPAIGSWRSSASLPSAERTMRWPTSSRSARRPSRATFGHCSLAVREGWIQSGIVGRQS